jgi:hypothetical protein
LSVLGLLTKYRDKYGLERLAEIFYRFKPLFLAFRSNKKLKMIINKIRKLAYRHHKPMPEDFLNNITAKIKQRKSIPEAKLKEELKKVNVFRKIRLAYALKFRTNDTESILYKIRNGKGYATDFGFNNHRKAKAFLDIVLNSIVNDIKPNVKGKKVYLPDYIKYSLPATEKQFTGYFPSGTYVSVPKDIVFGVHWENINGHRIDLDLSLLNGNKKIGWDDLYRSEDRGILFSGDITDAPKGRGATEVFYVKKQKENTFLLMVNYYNFEEDVEVPFKILVAKELVKDFGKDYMVNPNNILCIAKSVINQKQRILGLLATTEDNCKFYFTEVNLGCSITSYGNPYTKHALNYLTTFYQNTIDLNDILLKAGMQKTSEDKCDINLSPEKLEKDTILSLLKKQ